MRAAKTSKDSHEEDGFTAVNFMETLKGMSGRMESVERKVESVQRKVERVERKVENLERKVESIENKVEEIGVHLIGELTHIKEDLRILVKKIERLHHLKSMISRSLSKQSRNLKTLRKFSNSQKKEMILSVTWSNLLLGTMYLA